MMVLQFNNDKGNGMIWGLRPGWGGEKEEGWGGKVGCGKHTLECRLLDYLC